MNGRNSLVIVIIFLLVGVLVFYMMFKVRDVDEGISEQKSEEHTAELADSLNTLDYEIYLIGELPAYMEGIADHVTIIPAGRADSTTLPVSEGNIGFTSYDEDGNVLEHIEQRDYASYMMIIINTSEELSETALAALQDCAVDNHVPVLLIGLEDRHENHVEVLLRVGRGFLVGIAQEHITVTSYLMAPPL